MILKKIAAKGRIQRKAKAKQVIRRKAPRSADQLLETLKRIEYRCLCRIEGHRRSAGSLEEYYARSPEMGEIQTIYRDCREILEKFETTGGSK